MGPKGKGLRVRARPPSDALTLGSLRCDAVDAVGVPTQVSQAGIELRLDNAPFNVIMAQLMRGDFDIEVLNYGKNNTRGTVNQFRAGNTWGYANPRPHELIQHSTTELDDARWLQHLYEADRVLWADLPIVPLFQVPLYLAVRNTFVNIQQDVAGGSGGIFWNARHGGGKAS